MFGTKTSYLYFPKLLTCTTIIISRENVYVNLLKINSFLKYSYIQYVIDLYITHELEFFL